MSGISGSLQVAKVLAKAVHAMHTSTNYRVQSEMNKSGIESSQSTSFLKQQFFVVLLPVFLPHVPFLQVFSLLPACLAALEAQSPLRMEFPAAFAAAQL